MSEAGVAYVTLIPSMKGFSGQVQSQMMGLGGVGSKAGASTGKGFMGGFGAQLAKVGAIVGFSAALTGAVKSGIGFNSTMEQNTIALTTMLGSADMARDVIDQVTQMAAKTPFQFPELAESTKKLIAFGEPAETAVETMRRLGDVASGIGAPISELSEIYGKIRVQGRVFMEDINQLSGRGIPIYKYLAQVVGEDESAIREMVSAGKIGFPEIEKAFQAMTDEGGQFSGLMEAQSQSFAGLWSTVKDGFTQIMGKALKPFFEFLRDKVLPFLVSFTDTINALFGGDGDAQAAFKDFGEKIGSVISRALDWLTEAIPKIATALLQWGIKFIEWVVPMIPPLLAKLAQLALRMLEWVKEQLPALITKLGEWASAFVSWLGPRVPDIIAELVKMGLALLQWIATDLLPKLLTALWNLGVAMVKATGAAFAGVWEKIKDPFVRAWNWLSGDEGPKSWPGRVWEWLKEIGGKIRDALADVWSAITKPFVDAWNWVKEHVINPMRHAWYEITHLGIGEPDTEGPTSANNPGWGSWTTNPDYNAAGNIFHKPTLTWVGEKWRPEVLLPMTDIDRSMDLLGQSGMLGQIAQRIGLGSGGSMAVNSNSNVFHITIERGAISDLEGLIDSIQTAARLQGAQL